MKHLLWVSVWLLMLPVIEITRQILWYQTIDPNPKYYFEVGLYWLCWLVAFICCTRFNFKSVR